MRQRCCIPEQGRKEKYFVLNLLFSVIFVVALTIASVGSADAGSAWVVFEVEVVVDKARMLLDETPKFVWTKKKTRDEEHLHHNDNQSKVFLP